MKKQSLLIVLFVVLGLYTRGQVAMDTIITNSKVKIPCKIIELNGKFQSIIYTTPGNEEVSIISIGHVYQYFWNGGLYLADSYIPKHIGSYSRRLTPSQSGLVNPSASPFEEIGNELVNFATLAQIGLALEGLSMVIISLPNMMKDKEIKKPENFIYAGVGVGFVGFIFHVISFSNARKAGNLLKFNDRLSIKSSTEGVGIAVPIK
ncbi:MAG: hypothetical protein IPN08_10245 [Bacteroidales bacterium]|nr:hypothetical protein [Bacteroidales bacterium]MBK9357750.1 hypothetical protein [Bacteroidales bacterium]